MRRFTIAVIVRLTASIVAGIVAGVGAVFVGPNPASAIPPPPTLLCANDFGTDNLTGWSRSGGRWAVVDGAYQQRRTSGTAKSWFQADEWSAHSTSARVQLVEAGRPSSFVSLDVAVRGATTSYRLALLARGVVELQYLNSGAVTVLASQPMPVTTGTWYSITLGLSPTGIAAIVGGGWLFDSATIGLPPDGHILGGVGFTAKNAAGAFDDLSVVHYGPTSAPRCP